MAMCCDIAQAWAGGLRTLALLHCCAYRLGFYGLTFVSGCLILMMVNEGV